MHKFLDRLMVLGSMLALGFAIGIIFKNVYIQNSKRPFNWKHEPIIINCIGDQMSEETIIDAIKFWESKGEGISFYQYEKIDKICNAKGATYGVIVLRNAEVLKENTLAQTKVYTTFDEIVGADVFFREGTYNYDMLLEHELGHALGHKHTTIPGHVMHPHYDLMGDKFW